MATSTKDLVRRHARTQAALRVLLDPAPLGRGPIRLEAWNDSEWSQEQREAYEQLRAEAGLPANEPWTRSR